jgi:hypothetical protein
MMPGNHFLWSNIYQQRNIYSICRCWWNIAGTKNPLWFNPQPTFNFEFPKNKFDTNLLIIQHSLLRSYQVYLNTQHFIQKSLGLGLDLMVRVFNVTFKLNYWSMFYA